MAHKMINIRVQVDRETDLELEEWSEREGRSKRRHLSILARRLAGLRKTNPDDLRRLGLMQTEPVTA